MLVGYNHNIKHKGKEYHIQTEDSGESSMMITTLLYCDGTIVGSKKTNYAKVAAEYEDYELQLKELMQTKRLVRLNARMNWYSLPLDTVVAYLLVLADLFLTVKVMTSK